jgi:hypothetical protein
MSLTSNQRKSLASALTSAFPTENDLAEMVDYYFSQKLSRITERSSIDHMIFHLIQWAEAHNQIPKLIQDAFTANPSNPQLHDFALSWARTEGRVEKILLAALEEHPHDSQLQGDLNRIFQELKTQISILTNDRMVVEEQAEHLQKELQEIRQKAVTEIQGIRQNVKTEISIREQRVHQMTEWIVTLKNERESKQRQIDDLTTTLQTEQKARQKADLINRRVFSIAFALEVSLALFVGMDSLANGTLFPWLNRHWSDFGSMALSALVFFVIILLFEPQWRIVFWRVTSNGLNLLIRYSEKMVIDVFPWIVNRSRELADTTFSAFTTRRR